VQGDRPRLGTALMVAAGAWLAFRYYDGPMYWYSWQYRENLPAYSVVMALLAPRSWR
jgi:hypothetical protein